MKNLFTVVAAVALFAASGWSSAAPLDVAALCSEAEFMDDAENQIYQGQYKYKKTTLDTALVVTPTMTDDGVVVFYLWANSQSGILTKQAAFARWARKRARE